MSSAMNADAYIETNRHTWNEWATVHMTQASGYPVEAFKAGKVGWTRNIPDDIGPVCDKSILHLQCHFGMDTLMWVKEGAYVTGVDFSTTAIEGARTLNAELGLNAEFVQSDIYTLPQTLTGEFDIVLTYYGTIVWLPDLEEWADVIAWYLKPGGFFYLADTHPFMHMLEARPNESVPVINYNYFMGEPEVCESDGSTYAAPGANTQNRITYQWTHSLSSIVNALTGAGLQIEFLHEFPYSFYDHFYYNSTPLMEQDDLGWWHLKVPLSQIPLMFSIQAHKPLNA